MSVTQLAHHESVGVSVAAACQWEGDDGTEPTHEHLAGIAAALGLSMGEFWGPIPKRKAS